MKDTITKVVTDSLGRTFKFEYAVIQLVKRQESDPLSRDRDAKRTVWHLHVGGAYYGAFAVRANAASQAEASARALQYNGMVIDGSTVEFING